VWVSLGNAMKAKQSKAKQSKAKQSNLTCKAKHTAKQNKAKHWQWMH
jgi:hypothetical protein